MADRLDYFFRQKVTEAELDLGFADLEQADFDLTVDHGLIGIMENMGVSEKSGTPDLTVDIQGPGTAYSKQGERINFSSTQNQDMSIDDGAVSTAVAAPGNARIVSIYATFDRLLSDSRLDGNSLTVFFQRDESFDFSVVAGAEAVAGLEVPPALDPNKILLGDITLIFGQTQIFNADIDVAETRRESAFVITDGATTLRSGTAEEAIQAVATTFNLDDIVHKSGAETITGIKDFEALIRLAAAGAFLDVTGLTSSPVSDPIIRDHVRQPTGLAFSATPDFMLLASFLTDVVDTNSNPILSRIYVTGSGGIMLTFNAEWDNATSLWTSDANMYASRLTLATGTVTGSPAFGGNPFEHSVREVAAMGETWAENTGWSSGKNPGALFGGIIGDGVSFFSGAVGVLAEGRLLFNDATGTQFGTNPAIGDNPGLNALYGKNIVKVWCRVEINAGTVTLVGKDSFGIASVAANVNDFDINYSNIFANTQYSAVCSYQFNTARVVGAIISNRAAGSSTWTIYRFDTAATIAIGAIAEFFDIVICGEQG